MVAKVLAVAVFAALAPAEGASAVVQVAVVPDQGSGANRLDVVGDVGDNDIVLKSKSRRESRSFAATGSRSVSAASIALRTAPGA
jgi:hypothetical protein